jgi:hypothetical protein
MNEEASQHRPSQTIANSLAEPEFWYGNFQLQQREFLPIGFLLALRSYVRERGSRESTPVPLPTWQPGTDRPPCRPYLVGRTAVFLAWSFA